MGFGSGKSIGSNTSNNYYSTADVTANVDGSVFERLEDLKDRVDSIGTSGSIGANNADNAFASTLTAANEDGSVLERLEQIQEATNKGSGTALAANKSLVDALGTDGTTVTDAAVSVLGAIGADNANNAFASTNVAANADGSVLERLEEVQQQLSGTSGVATFPASAAAGNGVSLAEVLRYVQDTLLANAGTYVPGLGYKVSKTEDVNQAAQDDLFTVTGKVLITLWTGEVTNALGAAVTDYKIRVKTSNIDLCAASGINGAAIGFLFQMNSDAGDTLVNTASATETADTNGKGLANRVVGIAAGSLTIESLRTAGDAGDEIVHTLWYLPLEAGASVAAAA